MLKTILLSVAALSVIILSLSSCTKPEGPEITKNFMKREWHADSVINFKFEVGNALLPYKLVYNVRSEQKYPYANLHLKYTVMNDSGRVIDQALQRMYLAQPVSGRPLGKAMGDLHDEEIIAFERFKFPYPGKYSIQFKHYMRDTLLKGVDSFQARLVAEQEK